MGKHSIKPDFLEFRNSRYDGAYNSIKSVAVDKDKGTVTFEAVDLAGLPTLSDLFAKAGIGYEAEVLDSGFHSFTVDIDYITMAIDSIVKVEEYQGTGQKEWLQNIKAEFSFSY